MIDNTTFDNKKVAFHTLGCKLNFAETSTIGKLLADRGAQPVQAGETPDICVVNTCSVTELANKKCRQEIRKLSRRYPDAVMVVTGCYAQLNSEEVADIEGVDIVVGNDQKAEIADFVDRWYADHEPTVKVTALKDIRQFIPSCSRGDRTRFFLKVQDGCNYYCSYCTIPRARGRIFDTVETDNGQYNDITDIFWATGAALTVRTEEYLAAGGLDKDFFAHMEEIDLCWRLHQRGLAIRVIPQSVVFHLGGGSLPASNPKKTYLNFRNNLFLLYKNLPPREGRRMLLIRRLYDTLAFFVFMAKMDFANARAILRAHNDYRHQKSRYDNVRPQRSIMGDFPCCHRDIILDYNLRRIRHYSDLK